MNARAREYENPGGQVRTRWRTVRRKRRLAVKAGGMSADASKSENAVCPHAEG